MWTWHDLLSTTYHTFLVWALSRLITLTYYIPAVQILSIICNTSWLEHQHQVWKWCDYPLVTAHSAFLLYKNWWPWTSDLQNSTTVTFGTLSNNIWHTQHQHRNLNFLCHFSQVISQHDPNRWTSCWPYERDLLHYCTRLWHCWLFIVSCCPVTLSYQQTTVCRCNISKKILKLGGLPFISYGEHHVWPPTVKTA